MVKISNIPEPFNTAVEEVKKLEKYDEYIGAFIFGSVARGDQGVSSDLDIKVVTTKNEFCDNVNHPFINGIKLDLSFNNLDNLQKWTDNEIKERRRVPMIAESIIIFDKARHLSKLKKKSIKVRPKKVKKESYQWNQYLIYHMDDKVKRSLKTNPNSSLLSMSINLKDILSLHYKINQKWWISDKRMLNDLENWDPKFAKVLRKFLLESDLATKYKYWSQMLDHVCKPIGGRQKIDEINCVCKICKEDLANLSKVASL